MTCPNFKKLAVGIIETKNRALLARLRCKQWSCDYCAKQNSLAWRKHLYANMPKFGLKWTFITITCLGDYHRAKTTYAKLTQEWGKVLKRLKRYTNNNDLAFIRIFELHKSGQVHCHALIQFNDSDSLNKRAYRLIKNPKTGVKELKYRGVGYAYFKNLLSDLGLGKQFDYTPLIDFETRDNVNLSQVVGYVLKYITKNDDETGHIHDLPKGARKIITSRGLSLKDEKTSLDAISWSLKPVVTIDFVAQYETIDITTHKKVTFDDFENSDFYPNWFE